MEELLGCQVDIVRLKDRMDTFLKKMNKITFITYHNWETKRHGGFHAFAEYTCRLGIETMFFSFSRPYYIRWKKNERLNWKVLKFLKKGCCYDIGGFQLWNFTWPTLALPGFLRSFFTDNINKWLMCHSFTPFRKIVNKWLKDTDCFVFESCDALFLLDLIREYFPNSLIIYRPSDPIIDFKEDGCLVEAEKRMIFFADKILLVNNESLELYRNKFSDVFNVSKFYVISNGIYLSAYQKKYNCPSLLKGKLSALYIGASKVDWNLLFQAAKDLPYITFVIITPNFLNKKEKNQIDKIPNLEYIPGILPSEVPKWVTNANLILEPLLKNLCFYDRKCLGLTAQNYKAMAAKKTIVAYMLPTRLSKYGLIITDNKQDFIRAVATNINKKEKIYSIDIKEKDWSKQCALFMRILLD